MKIRITPHEGGHDPVLTSEGVDEFGGHVYDPHVNHVEIIAAWIGPMFRTNDGEELAVCMRDSGYHLVYGLVGHDGHRSVILNGGDVYVPDLGPGVHRIAQERRRVIRKGRDADWDDQYAIEDRTHQTLTDAARCYIAAAQYAENPPSNSDGRMPAWARDNVAPWPWDESFWHPSPDPIENLAAAGQCIAADIDRHERAARRAADAEPVSPEPQ